MEKNYQLPDQPNNEEKVSTKNQKEFSGRITKLNALACSNIKSDNFNLENEMEKSKSTLEALNTTNSLQQMLAAQMISIHRLQQMSVANANGLDNIENKQYFTNTAIKLANCFTQQANLLARLQGQGSQKIVVERVEVYQGGQAVVGTINGSTRTCKEKK